jgi:hypothetical protein
MCHRVPYDRYLLCQSSEFFIQDPWRLFLKRVYFGARYVRPLFPNHRFRKTKHLYYFSVQTQENCIEKAWYSRNSFVDNAMGIE